MKKSVSVIITTLNAGEIFDKCLDSIVSQDYSGKYEIIVVDAGSNDETVEIARKYKAKVIIKKGINRAEGRQLGVDNASGEIIVFTDSDCVPTKNWLKNLVKNFPGCAAVGGIVKSADMSSCLNRIEDWRIRKFYERREKQVKYIPTWNAAFLKSVIDDVGGFNLSLGVSEDVDISTRILKKEYLIIFDKEAQVYHYHRSTLKSYLNQNYLYGQGRAVLMKLHGFDKKIFLFFTLMILSLINLIYILYIYIKNIPVGAATVFLLLFPFFIVSIFNPYSIPLAIDVFLYGDPVFILIPFLEYLRSLVQALGFFKGIVRPDARVFCRK